MTTEVIHNKRVIILNDVRLSFNSLWFPTNNPQFPDSPPRCTADLLLDKEIHAEKIAELQNIIEKYKKVTGAISNPNLVPLHDGDLKNAEYEDDKKKPDFVNQFILKTKLKVEEPGPIRCLGLDPSVTIKESDNLFYMGCYVNAVVELSYYTKSKRGNFKGIIARPVCLQYARAGQRFGVVEYNPLDYLKDIRQDLAELPF